MPTWLFYVDIYIYNIFVQVYVNGYNKIYIMYIYTLILYCLTAQSALDFSYKKHLFVLSIAPVKD